jgi:rhamnosyltransferase
MTGEQGQSATPRCSIVIRAYNEAEHIGRLLEGIQQQTIKDVEVILVDSGSADETVAIARRYDARVVHIEPETFTFGRSLNLGIAQSRADLVVIASAHVYPVYPDWLERLLSPFEDPQVGLTYGKQRGVETTFFSERQIFARWFPDHAPHYQEHPFCNNANAAIRRGLWEQHPYDESLSGLEDLAWAKWLLEQNYHIMYVPDAEIAHIHNETPRKVYNRYRREAMAFKHIFPQEHFNFLDFIRLFTTNAASDLWHAAQQKVLGRHWRSIIWFRWMQFWGTYQGYRQSGPLTWQLRQTFYYPKSLANPVEKHTRHIEPIRYNDGKQD